MRRPLWDSFARAHARRRALHRMCSLAQQRSAVLRSTRDTSPASRVLERGDALPRIAQLFSKALHERAALGNPIGERVEAARLNPAVSHAPYLLSSEQTALLH